MSAPVQAPEVLSVGRVSVDLYASQPGLGFEGEQTFVKSVGGSPVNVAVAAARLGRRAAVATKVGGDPLGRYVLARLAEWGVSLDHVGVEAAAQTALALVALDPPESPQIAFYRGVAAPDTTLVEADLPDPVVQSCGVLWVSHAALAQGSTATAALSWLESRARSGHTVLDLDYRPALWPDLETARGTTARAIGLSTVVIGNLDECEMALGTRAPDTAADELLAAGVELAVVKLGATGVLLADGTGRWSVPATPVDVVCGLGAGDAFGGALCHGLLAGWHPERIGRAAARAGSLVAGRLTCSHDMPTLAELEPDLVSRSGT
ncbi:MAG: PfkB family carbohydrate kinase [Nocardioidaceae bacterium]